MWEFINVHFRLRKTNICEWQLKKIYSLYAVVLKLSVAVHTSFAEILMYQLSLHDVSRCHGKRVSTCRLSQISVFLTKFFVKIIILPLLLTKTAELVYFHTLLSFSINFASIYVIFWLPDKTVKSKMADPRWQIYWRHMTS